MQLRLLSKHACFALASYLLATLASANPSSSVIGSANSPPKGVHQMSVRKLVNSDSLLAKRGSKHFDQVKAKMNWMRNKNFNPVKNFKGMNDESKKKQNVIYDFQEHIYVADITLGIPPQEFTVMLDTGFEDFWVVDKSCDCSQDCFKYCYKDSDFCYRNCDEYCCEDNPVDKRCACENKRKFDSSKSKTYKKDGRFTDSFYRANYVNCYLGNDTLRFGEVSEFWALSVPGVTVGQATSIGRNFRNIQIDGILGLGYDTLFEESPLATAIRKGLLAKPMFTVFLGSAADGSKDKGGGVFTYGGLDTKNCGPVRGWTPIIHESTDQFYYQFEIEGVSHGKKFSTNIIQGAKSETGNSLILGDSRIVRNLAKNVGATYNDLFKLYFIDCDADYEPITFTISGKNYSLPKEVLTIDFFGNEQSKIPHLSKKRNTCVFGIEPLEIQPEDQIKWFMGDPFFRQYCHIHDIGNMRMGFAPSIQPKQREQKE